MRCSTIGACQSAATSEIAKALLVTSLTHVSGATASVQTFTFTFTVSRPIVYKQHSVDKISIVMLGSKFEIVSL